MAAGALLQSLHLTTLSQQDNFYSPENDRFYASQPYAALDPGRREIRLLQIHANRIQGADLPELFPHWNKPGTDFQSMSTLPPFLSGNPPEYNRKKFYGPIQYILPAGWGKCQTEVKFRDTKGLSHLPPSPPNFVTFYVNQYTGHTQWEPPQTKVPEAPPEFPHGFLACELVDKVSLGTANGRYIAVSYCSGDPSHTAQIMVNGFLFNVSGNLEHALECVRKHQTKDNTEKFFIWADQICIDQSNVDERSQQVQFMPEIFQNSGSVFACLSTVGATPMAIPPPPEFPIEAWRGRRKRRNVRKRKSRSSSTSSVGSRDSGDSGGDGERANSMLAPFSRIWKLFSSSTSKPPRKKVAPTTRRARYLDTLVPPPPQGVPPPPQGPPPPPGFPGINDITSTFLETPIPPPPTGPPSPPGPLTVLPSVPQRCDQVLKRIGIGDASRLRDPESIIQTLVEDLKSPQSHVSWAYDVGRVINSPWWTRVWSYPELILAARLLFIYQDQCWPWHVLSPFLHLFCEGEKKLVALKDDLEKAEEVAGLEEGRPRSKVWQKKSKEGIDPNPFEELDALREVVEKVADVLRIIRRTDTSTRERVAHFVKSRGSWSGPKKLSELVATAYLFRSTDPRDTVYAFSSLADPAYKIVPDYDSSNAIFHVLVDTAQKIVQTENSLDILDDAILLMKESYGFWLPSWVPNWGSKPRKDMLKCREHIHQTLPTQTASPNRAANATFHADEEHRINMLMRIQGQCLGTIAHIEQASEFLNVFSTSSDFIVETSPLARVGDQVWVLHGGRKVYILRKHLERQFSLIAEAFLFEEYPEVVSEYMVGKAIDLEEKGQAKAVEIDLV